MKYLRVLILLSLALFCGSKTSHAQFDFHATVLDPACTDPTECQLHAVDLGVPFAVALGTQACTDAGVMPTPTGLYGCFVGTNLTGGNITSFVLDFANIPTITGCDTNVTNVTQPPVAFSVSNCVVDGSGGYDLTFSGGSIIPGHSLIILEEGVAPGDFRGMGTVNPTPEPDSLLLLSTGVMMTGLYVAKQRYTAKQRRLFGFIKR